LVTRFYFLQNKTGIAITKKQHVSACFEKVYNRPKQVANNAEGSNEMKKPISFSNNKKHQVWRVHRWLKA